MPAVTAGTHSGEMWCIACLWRSRCPHPPFPQPSVSVRFELQKQDTWHNKLHREDKFILTWFLVHGFWFFCFEACGRVEFHGRLHTVSDPLTSWQPQTESYWKELGRPQWPDFPCLYCSEGRWGRVLFRMCTGCLYCSLGGRCARSVSPFTN